MSKESHPFSPKYLNVSANHFTHLVIDKSLSNRKTIVHWFRNIKVVHFFRQYTHLLDKVNHLKLEQDYWNCVAAMLTNMIIWLSHMPKVLTRNTSINWEYPRTEKNIKKRQRTISNQLKQAQDNLNAHLQKAEELPYRQMQQGTIEHIILSKAIETFVHQGQQTVRTNFEQKKKLLEIDRNEVQLVKSFYDLNPTSDQIEFAREIWRLTSKTCRQVVPRVNNDTIQDNNNNIVTNEELKLFPKHIGQQHRLFSLKSSAPLVASIIEARQANIEKRATQITEFKTLTPKKKSPRFHRTHQCHWKYSMAD